MHIVIQFSLVGKLEGESIKEMPKYSEKRRQIQVENDLTFKKGDG